MQEEIKYINYGDSVQIGNPCTDYSMFSWVTSTNGNTYLSDSTMPQIWSKPPVTTTYYVTKTQGNNTLTDTVTVFVSGGVGIENFSSKIPFSIYPNPTATILTIQSTTQNSQYTIYDLIGDEILHTQQKQIDISTLSNGIYFIRVGNFTQKFVVQH